MSKAILICFRDPKNASCSRGDMELLSKRLVPDNITPNPPVIIEDSGIFVCVLNPTKLTAVKDTSVCLGSLIKPEDDWWKPMTKVPDGTYALFRSDESYIELVSDAVASRTIWYAQTDDLFVASTSQRAIVSLLGDFTPNRTAFSWMLSSGTLGPGLSWDIRIGSLSGNSRLLLDRRSWRSTIDESSAFFHPATLSEEQHERALRYVLEEVFEDLGLDYSEVVLPLSGGYDSRAVLMMLKDRENLRCVTWGLKSSLSEKHNDAYVAKALAESLNVKHTYFETETSDEPVDVILERFIVAGEGRIDHISGYMDGFKIWKYLFEEGFSAIIRADEGFGWSRVNCTADVLRSIGLTTLSDFSNMKNPEDYGLEEQVFPGILKRRDHESLAMWRDRLYHEFRIPVCLAALSDLKCGYVELINPFLSRKIIEQVRRMPDHLRTDKDLFRKIVRSMSPDIEFAKYPAIADPADITGRSDLVELISGELDSDHARDLLPKELVTLALAKMKVTYDAGNGGRSFRGRLKARVPTGMRNLLRRTVARPRLDYNVLAFRAYIICRMNRLLSDDAKVMKSTD